MRLKDVNSPQLTPIINRPRKRTSYELRIFVNPMRQAPAIPTKLFSNRPPFLKQSNVQTVVTQPFNTFM